MGGQEITFSHLFQVFKVILAEKFLKNWKLGIFGQFQILINPLMPNEFGNFQKILLKFF